MPNVRDNAILRQASWQLAARALHVAAVEHPAKHPMA